MQPTALHCTSTFGLFIWRIKGVRPPRETISTLFWPARQSVKREGACASREWRTVYGEVAQRSRSSSLNFDVRAFQEEEDGLECRAVDRPYICHTPVSPFRTSTTQQSIPRRTSFSDLGKSQTCTPLQVDVLAVYQRAQRGEGIAGEKIGLGSLFRYPQVSTCTYSQPSTGILQNRRALVQAVGVPYIFQVIEEVGDGFAFAIREDVVVVNFRAACWAGGSRQ